jgi:hypothetical protein
MYRVYILFLLAIGLSAFAVDSSQSILQAKKISDTSVSLSWTPIPEAIQYKIFYDESDLLDPLSPNPLFDTDFITKTEGELTKMLPSTDYTLVVHGYTSEGKDLGKTIPLHLKTLRDSSQMSIISGPIATNDVTLELSFSHPIDVKKSEITLKNTKNNKNIIIQETKTSPEDLRIVMVVLKDKLELSVPYELTMKKVVSLDGLNELPPENRTPLRVAYSGELPPLIADTTVVSPPLVEDEPVEENPFQEPVPIDHLPQTGPAHLALIIFLSVLVTFFIQKKLSKRA